MRENNWKFWWAMRAALRSARLDPDRIDDFCDELPLVDLDDGCLVFE